MFALKLLGPVVLQSGGKVLPLRTQKALALLVLLAAQGPCQRARLSAWLWPALTESDARRNLRRELARLRQAGGAGAVQADGDQLALAPAVSCDLALFEADLAAGQTDAALAHWCGTPAEGLQLENAQPFDDWLAGLRTRLQQQRRRALEASADACQARGDPEAALRGIDTLLAEDPLQEALHRQAMQLHALCGRREAAIAQYERCRALLASELGLAPMAQTESLLVSLRDPAPAPPPLALPAVATASTAWPREMPLVGRQHELAALQRAWAQGRSLLIEGEAGIGKTRLAQEFAAAQGAYALAQCRGGDRPVPYASFTRALRQLAGDTLASAGLPSWVQTELARLLPDLGAAPAPIGSAEEKRHFFEACAAAWQALADGNFDAVVIDDYHLADDASRALFVYIAQQLAEGGTRGSGRIFVFRPELDAAARADMAALEEGAQALRLRLAPLAAEPVLELVQRLSGAAAPRRFAAHLERATGGNPFFVAETLRHWLALQLLSVGADGIWQTPFDHDTPDYRELPVPDSVRSAVLARVHRLPDAARRLLEAAALAAEPFSPALLAGACALSEVEALAAIDDAVQAHMLREREGPFPQAVGYAFSHDLVQLALDSALSPERRRLVHRRLALGAEVAALPPTEIARHWEAGGEPQRAVAHRLAAADQALALYADADAERHWAAAQEDGPTLAQQMHILRRRWGVLRNRDDRPGLEATVLELDALHQQALAQAAAEPALQAVAHDAAIEAAQLISVISRSAEALQRIDACLAAPLVDPAQRALAAVVRTQALNGLGRTAEAAQVAEAALATAALAPALKAQLLHALIYSHFLRSEPRPALACARRTLALWQSLGHRRSVARAHANIGLLLGMLDDQAGAVRALQQALAIAADLRLVEQQREVSINLAYAHLHLGEPALALAVVQAAWDLSPHFSQLSTPVFFLGMRVQAHYQRGELDAALDCAEQAHARALALGDAHTLVDCVSMALDVYTWIGDHATAMRLIDSLQGVAMEGIPHYRVKLVFNLVLHALQTGDLAAACAHLTGIGEIDRLQQPVDQASARLRQAELALAEGNAGTALRWLQPLRDMPLHVETWALACAARLAAHTALGAADSHELALADAALASGRLPALPALQLQRERRRAALLRGDAHTADRLQASIAAEVARLAASLRARPAEQALFQARHG